MVKGKITRFDNTTHLQLIASVYKQTQFIIKSNLTANDLLSLNPCHIVFSCTLQIKLSKQFATFSHILSPLVEQKGSLSH